MPVMPPSASAITGLAALAAKANIGGKETGPAAVDHDNNDRFSAHFQRLLGKQAGGQLPTEAQTSQPNPGTLGEAVAPELAALPPFIEALGLNPASVAAPATDMPTAIPETSSHLAAIAAENRLHGAPAISAANPGPQGETRRLPFNLAALTTGAAAQNAAQPVPGSIVPANKAPVDELSAGREFSAQLVAAIGAGKEQALTPGNMAAAVQQAISSHSPAASTAASHADPVVARPVGASGWAEEIGNHVAWLANRSESRAELVLTPPQMGRVEISLTMKGDQATANFTSANPVVREALEAALPRLREILADTGIQLGQANVSADTPRQWAQQDKHGDNSASDPVRAKPGDTAISSAGSGSLSIPAGLKGGRGFVDVFA